jgi:CO/xanthine dehydrogenase FAD-binding subunit
MSAYFRPASLDEALAALARGPVVVAAGCTDLLATGEGSCLAGRVVDLTAVAGLRGISGDERGWRIGATTRWSDIIAANLPPGFDMLKAAAREVGSVQIQNAGTVGGNLCNASPAADGVPPLLALDAVVELASLAGRRRLPLAEFLTGVRRTALAAGEMVSAVVVPRSAGQGQSRFIKLGARRYLVISVASVAVRVVARDGRAEKVAIAVGACSPVPVRLAAVEARLTGLPLADLAPALDGAAVRAALDPIDDLRAGAGYRAGAAVELVRRALADLGGAGR